MRILVISGTGFIGAHAVRSLAGMGHEVTVFHRGQTEADLPSEVRHLHAPEFQCTPNCNIARWTDDFRRLHPEVVLYMVPIGEQDAEGVMSTFKGIARRVVAISSIDVYRAYGVLHRTEAGPTEPVPLTEDAPLRQKLYPYRGDPPTKSPEEPGYWYDKILAERRVMADPQLAGTVLRLPMVYGPGDGLHRLFPYLKRMDDQRPAILMDESLAQWRGSRGYVENIAAAIVLALLDERAADRIYNVPSRNSRRRQSGSEGSGRSLGGAAKSSWCRRTASPSICAGPPTWSNTSLRTATEYAASSITASSSPRRNRSGGRSNGSGPIFPRRSIRLLSIMPRRMRFWLKGIDPEAVQHGIVDSGRIREEWPCAHTS